MIQPQDLLIDVKNLRAYFSLREGIVKAVDGVSFQIPRGKVIGIVGESGSGKTVMARCLLRIEAPAKIVGGEIIHYLQNSGNPNQVDQINIHELNSSGEIIRSIRGNEISMVFQEPMTAFGPMHTIGNQIEETIRLHRNVQKDDARQLAEKALREVGMPRPEKALDSYPHQLSGGMRQRAMIAMALCCQPKLLIADEPTTALDVTTEFLILNLIREIQKSTYMSVLYITHSMPVISQIADEIIVMYLGKIVERANADQIFYSPKHPYTKALLMSIPRVDRSSSGRLEVIEGSLPDPYFRPNGCCFHPRCRSFIKGVCDRVEPPLLTSDDGSSVSCHLYHSEAVSGKVLS